MQPNSHVVQDVWRHYVVTGSIPHDVLRKPIDKAWRRCTQVGASPFVMRARELRQQEANALLERESNLIEAARPYMRALSRAAGDERHAAMLGDRNAVVVDVIGDEESVHGRERVPGPGSLLDEHQAGSNGIGSPLQENGYIELIGPEHFIEGFHPFTCQGLPLTGPRGDTVGVLSTSVRRVEASHKIREILFCAARGIEAELYRRELSLELQKLIEGETEASLLERLRQDMVQIHGAARLRLEKATLMARKGLDAEVAALINTATDLIDRFQRQSRLWLEIATAANEPPDFLDLVQLTREIAALLATEASVRGLEVVVNAPVPVPVFADRVDVQRTLFRAFLHAFQAAPLRSTVAAVVHADESLAIGVVHFPSVPEVVVAVDQYPETHLATGVGSYEVGRHHD
ncbi:MAG TPA: hypothetical protein VGE12_13895 [Noviherbaspirillum sp.]